MDSKERTVNYKRIAVSEHPLGVSLTVGEKMDEFGEYHDSPDYVAVLKMEPHYVTYGYGDDIGAAMLDAVVTTLTDGVEDGIMTMMTSN